VRWTDVPPEMRQLVIDIWAGTHAESAADVEALRISDPEKAAWCDRFNAANRAAIEYLAEPGGLVADPENAGPGTDRWEALARALFERGGIA
jgi:hypothetical protein